MSEIVQVNVESLIYTIREQQIMLDSDLARLYGVTTGRLNEAVKRNIKRFPTDFMFQLTQEEFNSLISQFAISKGRGGRRKLPYVFTEQGIAMLSGVLNSDTAIKVNISIMRVFVRIKQMLIGDSKLRLAVQALEYRMDKGEETTQMIINTIQQLLNPPVDEKNQKMGFGPK